MYSDTTTARQMKAIPSQHVKGIRHLTCVSEYGNPNPLQEGAAVGAETDNVPAVQIEL